MSNRVQLFLVLLLIATRSTPLRAEVGTQEQAIQAALENKEPEYLKNLAEEISRKLQAIAQKKELNTLRAKIGWVFTMRGIVNVAFAAARDAAYYRAYNKPYDGGGDLEKVIISSRNSRAWVATVAALEAADALNGAACLKAFDWVWDAAGQAAFIAAYVVVGEAIKDVSNKELEGKIAWRVAEWSAQNYFLMNLDTIVNGAHGEGGVFDALLAELPENLANSPVNSEEALILFLNHYFERLDQDAMLFLAPWLLQIMPGRHKDLPVAILPTEIVNSVLCSFVQTSCAKLTSERRYTNS